LKETLRTSDAANQNRFHVFFFQKKSGNVRLGESRQQVISSDKVQVQLKKKKASAVADAVNKHKGLEGRSVFEFGYKTRQDEDEG
jgi:phosphate starvation-inducible protein PhoH